MQGVHRLLPNELWRQVSAPSSCNPATMWMHGGGVVPNSAEGYGFESLLCVPGFMCVHDDLCRDALTVDQSKV